MYWLMIDLLRPGYSTKEVLIRTDLRHELPDGWG
jgi:hypothetical protein